MDKLQFFTVKGVINDCTYVFSYRFVTIILILITIFSNRYLHNLQESDIKESILLILFKSFLKQIRLIVKSNFAGLRSRPPPPFLIFVI